MKKRLLLVSLLFVSIFSFAQDAAHDWTVQLTAVANESPTSITLNWTSTETSGDSFYIFRKNKGTTGWGTTLAIVTSATTTYDDATAVQGQSYEYFVQRRTGSTIYAWGYISAGIKSELPANRGDILVLVDSTHIVALAAEIATLEEDLYNDGWMPKVIGVNPANEVTTVKGIVQVEYATLPNLQALYILGHIPVPYSGDLYPDAHADHEGAWPADVYYGDMDGLWSDFSVNNSVASDPRNVNVPGDGKFDQSSVPSAIELQVCRVDFNDLPVYAASEEELLKAYLDRAHEFKIGVYVPQERALFDQGGFTGMSEGFAQNALRNFVPMFDTTNVEEVDYFTTLTSGDYLWSYGCGAGSYTSAGALNGGSALTSATLGTTPMETTFTMLFGSYFGDWDKTNNFLRAALANGRTLSASWAGRPNWHYHTMGQGDNIGISARMSMDEAGDYLSLTLGAGFITGEGVHVAQLGDPSLRMYYLIPPTNLNVVNNSNVADLTWTASTDGTIDGYNVYRRATDGIWTKVNTSIVTGTSFSDPTIPAGGDIIYMVKSVKLKTNSSGTFYNESLGTSGQAFFTVGLENKANIDVSIYPNPTSEYITVRANAIEFISIYSNTGTLVHTGQVNANSSIVDLVNFESGIYYVLVHTKTGQSVQKVVKQ